MSHFPRKTRLKTLISAQVWACSGFSPPLWPELKTFQVWTRRNKTYDDVTGPLSADGALKLHVWSKLMFCILRSSISIRPEQQSDPFWMESLGFLRVWEDVLMTESCSRTCFRQISWTHRLLLALTLALLLTTYLTFSWLYPIFAV